MHEFLFSPVRVTCFAHFFSTSLGGAGKTFVCLVLLCLDYSLDNLTLGSNDTKDSRSAEWCHTLPKRD